MGKRYTPREANLRGLARTLMEECLARVGVIGVSVDCNPLKWISTYFLLTSPPSSWHYSVRLSMIFFTEFS